MSFPAFAHAIELCCPNPIVALRAGGLVLALGLPAAPAVAFERASTDHGAQLRWPRGDLTWVAARPAIDPAVVERAARAWNAPGCPALRLRAARAGEIADIVVRVHTATWPYALDEAAYTTVRADPDSGRAWQADLAINPRWWRDDRVDRVALLVHEFGHALGLAHTIDRGTVMFGGLSQRTAITDDDRAGVCAVFADVAPTPTPQPIQWPWLAALPAVAWLAVRAGRRPVQVPAPNGPQR